MPLLCSARGEPSIGTPVNQKNASRLSVSIATMVDQRNQYGFSVTNYFVLVIPIKLLGFLAEHEIIANAYVFNMLSHRMCHLYSLVACGYKIREKSSNCKRKREING